ncbi:glycosyltransferase family 4 protein, partial [Mucilaginibacter polytrichastri]
MVKHYKLLLITHKFYPDIGGTEANAEFLAKVFVGYGIEVHVLTWTLQTGEKEFPHKVIRNPSLRVLLKEHRWADIVFENSPVLRLSWPSLFIKKPLVISINTWLDDFEAKKQSLQSTFKYQWLKRATSIIAVSDAVRKRCWPTATVIENAYNDTLFLNTVPIANRQKKFVFLGRLVSDKGASMAVEAIYLLNKNALSTSPPYAYTLTVIGTGEEFDNLKKQVSEYGLDKAITFAGSMKGEALVNALNEHRYILIPSVWEEPFGIVALEGMACGCVPIVSASGG